jgi:hypothetical protein
MSWNSAPAQARKPLPSVMPLFIALEVDFLLALAQGANSAEWAVDLFMQAGGRPMVTPSAMQELQDIADNHSHPAQKHYGKLALSMLPTWGFLQPGFEDLDHQIVVISANKLLDRDFCPDLQSAMVFAEAAKLDCDWLLTYRPEMCSHDGSDRRLFMKLECHLADTFVMSPHQLISYFQARDKAASGTPA